MKGPLQTVFIFTLALTCLSSCSDLKASKTSTCEPACGSDLRCVDNQCQPIVCTDTADCFVGLVCNEGRCVYTCNGEDPCPSGQCNADLCSTSMECGDGDIRACSTACGEGVERCMNYTWTVCSAGVPASQDICGDGIDGDCDQQIDEGCPDCEAGRTRPCSNECGNGEQRCDGGTWAPCSISPPDASGVCPCMAGESEPCDTPCGRGVRTCEGTSWGTCLFNDTICQCEPGLVEACETACGSGERICDAGQWRECDAPQPDVEICGNGLDEDCDETADEECRDCNVSFLSGPMDVAELDSLYQQIPSVYVNGSVWLGYYKDRGGVRVSSYVKYSLRNNVLALESAVNSELETVINLSVNNARILGVGIARNRDFSVESFNTQGVHRTESMDLDGPIEHHYALGNTPTLYGLYRIGFDGLYLQALPDGAPRPQPVRLADASHHHLAAILANNGVTAVYENDAGNFPEGRVVAILRADLESRRLLFDKRLMDPTTGDPIFGGSVSVTFGSDRYLVTYTRRVNNQHRIYAVSVDLNGEVTDGPHEVYRAAPNQQVHRPVSVNSSTGALLAWAQSPGIDEAGTIKYMALHRSGISASPVVTVTRGIALFPAIVKSQQGTPAISWSETRQINDQLFHALRLASIPKVPTCQ